MATRDIVMAAAGVGGAEDPNFKNVSLLLTGDGTNGAQNNTFLDSSTNNFTITRAGNTTQGTFSPYGDLWSNYFDGSGDWLETAISATTFGSSNFTIECWLYYQGEGRIYANYRSDPGNVNGTELLIIGSDIYFPIYQANTNPALLLQVAHGMTLNTWNHIAVTRSSSTFTIWINGVSKTTGSYASALNAPDATVTYIGRRNWQGYTNYLTGFLSNFRTVIGTAVYTSAFTPSTTPLTAVSGTSLLTCQSNRFIDNSSNNFTITKYGDTKVQRFSPFNPTAPYSAATIGGSGYFDGTGDYIQTPSSSAFNLSGDFTVDLWVYFTGNPYGAGLSKEYFYSTASGGLAFLITGTQLKVSRTATADDMTVNFTTVAGQWYHFAISRNSGTMGIYANGTRLGTASVSSNYSTGALLTASGNNGYLSSWRVVNGTGLYTGSTLTVPTAPLTAISGTSLLCNFTNAGIPDAAMMNDLETVGNAQVSTSVKKYGTGSLAFDGSGDALSLVNSPNIQFGSGDFTVEFWTYVTTVSPAYQGFFVKRPNNGVVSPVQCIMNSATIQIYASTNGSSWAVAIGSSTAISVNTWYHVAVVRNGSSLTLYLNGNSVATSTALGTSALFTETNPMTIGADAPIGSAGANPLFGYIDDFRITKGYARYTANFTPPAQALPTY